MASRWFGPLFLAGAWLLLWFLFDLRLGQGAAVSCLLLGAYFLGRGAEFEGSKDDDE